MNAEPDEVLDRVRAADPAAGYQPDTQGLRRSVAGRTGLDLVAGPVGTLSGGRAGGRPRASWLAAAAAVALGLGVGGYAVGAAQPWEQTATSAGGSSQSAGRAGGESGGAEGPVDLSADESTAAEPSSGGDAAGAGQSGGTPAADRAAGTGGDEQSYPGGGGRTVFSAEGLSTQAGTASAWGLDATVAEDGEALGAVAAALGVDGEVRDQGWSWQVGSHDGGGPVVEMHVDGTASVSYWNPRADPWSCPGGDAGPGETGCPEPTGGPDPDEARAQVEQVLDAIGVDTSRLAWSVGEPEYGQTQVEAAVLVDGQRSGLAWHVSVSDQGIVGLWGSLATLTDLGAYPVVSEAEALERLTDPRFGPSGGWVPVEEESASEPVDEPVASEPTVPQPLEPGEAVAWPVQEATITEVRLGTGRYTQPDGAVALLPTYEFTDTQDRVWSVIAVAEERLDLTAGASER